ncbi:MAG: D-ribose pyranase [Coprococcus sp.]
MKRNGILNSDISRVLSYMGHTDRICIGDCGLPIPDEAERIDLALKFGQPRFMEVLREVGADMKIEKIVLARRNQRKQPGYSQRNSGIFLQGLSFNPQEVEYRSPMLS